MLVATSQGVVTPIGTVVTAATGDNFQTFSYAIQYQVSFTSLYTMTMLTVRSWIVHLTPIPCLPLSRQASTLCVVSGFVLVKVRALAHHLEACASSGSA